jgi:hypothetical protein
MRAIDVHPQVAYQEGPSRTSVPLFFVHWDLSVPFACGEDAQVATCSVHIKSFSIGYSSTLYLFVSILFDASYPYCSDGQYVSDYAADECGSRNSGPSNWWYYLTSNITSAACLSDSFDRSEYLDIL